MWKARELTDRAEILACLETDRLYAAYAIGDLEPELFAQSAWVGAERANGLQALALHFRGLKVPVLFLMGDSHGLRAILQAWHPAQASLTCRPEHMPMTGEFYEWDEPMPMWRMVLRPERFHPANGDCLRLTPAHVDPLAGLYALGSAFGFSAAQIPHGVFYGLWMEGRLVAAAGTHLVSPHYGVAAVGNVFTHPDHRGRGYGTATTGAVVAELLRLGIRDIILNVRQDNEPAVHIYEKLGFERYCPFIEGQVFARVP